MLVSAGRAVASMRREAANWITNVKQGANAVAMPADREMEELAIAATAAVEGDFCGVDLLRDESGRAAIIEVNSMPAWINMLLLSSSGPIKTPVGACATAAESTSYWLLYFGYCLRLRSSRRPRTP